MEAKPRSSCSALLTTSLDIGGVGGLVVPLVELGGSANLRLVTNGCYNHKLKVYR
jgi:hypothetical protein